MASNIELQISKVANGYLVSVIGGKISDETMSLIPALSEARRVHNFVFTDIYEMFVFIHHLMEPLKEGSTVHNGKITPNNYNEDGVFKMSSSIFSGLDLRDAMEVVEAKETNSSFLSKILSKKVKN